jgi:hypothetical protein
LNFAVSTTCTLNPFLCFKTFLSLTTNNSCNSSMKTWTEAISSCGINLIVKKRPSKAWSVSSIVYLSFSNSIFWNILLLVFLGNLFFSYCKNNCALFLCVDDLRCWIQSGSGTATLHIIQFFCCRSKFICIFFNTYSSLLKKHLYYKYCNAFDSSFIRYKIYEEFIRY